MLAIAGAALVLVGGVLPWLHAGGTDASAWRISLVGLATAEGLGGGVPAGAVLLAAAVGFVPRVPRHILFVAGAVCATVVGMAAIRAASWDLGWGPGIALTAAGSAGLVAQDIREWPGPKPVRRRGAIVAVLAALAIAGVTYGALTSDLPERLRATPSPAAEPTGVRTFTDDELGIAVDIPRRWLDTKQLGVAVLYDPSTAPGRDREQAGLGVELALDPKPPGDLGTAVTTRLQSRGDYRFIGSGDAPFAGKTAFRHEYEISSGGTRVRIVELFVERGGDRVLRVAAFARTDIRERHVETLNTVLASARFLE